MFRNNGLGQIIDRSVLTARSVSSKDLEPFPACQGSARLPRHFPAMGPFSDFWRGVLQVMYLTHLLSSPSPQRCYLSLLHPPRAPCIVFLIESVSFQPCFEKYRHFAVLLEKPTKFILQSKARPHSLVSRHGPHLQVTPSAAGHHQTSRQPWGKPRIPPQVNTFCTKHTVFTISPFLRLSAQPSLQKWLCLHPTQSSATPAAKAASVQAILPPQKIAEIFVHFVLFSRL